MWDNYRRCLINRDHAIVVPRAFSPGSWFGAGNAWLAPLYRKRNLLIDREKWVYAWTLYNEKVGDERWLTPRSANSLLHFSIEVKSRDPSGWYFTVPIELRIKTWLPRSGELVVLEHGGSEFNVWNLAAYNEESILEADSQ